MKVWQTWRFNSSDIYDGVYKMQFTYWLQGVQKRPDPLWKYFKYKQKHFSSTDFSFSFVSLKVCNMGWMCSKWPPFTVLTVLNLAPLLLQTVLSIPALSLVMAERILLISGIELEQGVWYTLSFTNPHQNQKKTNLRDQLSSLYDPHFRSKNLVKFYPVPGASLHCNVVEHHFARKWCGRVI